MSSISTCFRWCFICITVISGFVTQVVAEAKIQSIAAGNWHSCAVVEGAVWCWGNNKKGQLGDGTTINRYLPVKIDSLSSNMRQVSVGDIHSCAVSVNEEAWCWGSNVNRQLCGNCKPSSTRAVLELQPVKGLEGKIRNISAHGLHTAAIVDESAVVWGRITWEYKGDKYPASPYDLTLVNDLPGKTTRVKAGGFTYGASTCAIVMSGDVYCWGYKYGPVPKKIDGLPDKAVDVGSGENHGCALMQNGEVYCWRVLSSNILKPAIIKVEMNQPLTEVTQLSVGAYNNCAVTADSGLYCWGWMRWDQFGKWYPALGQGYARPIIRDDLTPLSDVSMVSAGAHHTCAVVAQKLYCWGSNESGQLGQGRPESIHYFNHKVANLVAGFTYSCVRFENQRVDCWGGLPQKSSHLYTTADPNTLISTGSKVRLIASGGREQPFICFAYIHTLKCVGSLRTEFKTESRIQLLSAGFRSACFTDEADLWCWGKNAEGMLDDDIFNKTPKKIEGIEAPVSAIGVGEYHLCIIAEGDVWCWGYNRYGQLGDGSKSATNKPVKVKSLQTTAIAIAAGTNHSCAAMENGKVYCWGDVFVRDSEGEKWTLSKDGLPHEMVDLQGAAVSLVAGSNFTCALLKGGEVYCWGSNLDGELVPGMSESSATPLKVTGIDGGASQIAAGKSHACAVLKTGGVKCWGAYEPDGIGSRKRIVYPVEVKFPSQGKGLLDSRT